MRTPSASASGAAGDPVHDIVSEQLEAQLEGLLALAGLPEIPETLIRALQRAEAQTADGPVGAAAAISANLDYGLSLAALADGGTLVTSTVPVVAATGDMDGNADANANGVNSATGVGVAVALNVDGQRTESDIGGNVTAPGVTLQTVQSGDGLNKFTAHALSGGGGGNLGVAGAFAL